MIIKKKYAPYIVPLLYNWREPVMREEIIELIGDKTGKKCKYRITK
jgi:hypothetical protein